MNFSLNFKKSFLPTRGLLSALVLLQLPAAQAMGATTVTLEGSNPIAVADFDTNLSPLTSPTELVSSPQTVDGFRLTQVNGDPGESIFVNFSSGGSTGGSSWFPDQGDSGYTEITLSSGSNFQSLAILIGSFTPGHTLLLYQLVDNGLVIDDQTLNLSLGEHWLGITGGGFDTVRLRSANAIDDPGATFASGSFNTLAIHHLTATVPSPSAMMMSGAAISGLLLRRRRRPA